MAKQKQADDLAKEWLADDQKSLDIAEFREMGEKIFTMKQELDAMKKECTYKQKELDALKSKAAKLMESAGLEKQHIPNFGLLYFKEYSRISAPKEVSDKKALAKYFEKKGIFWEMFSVNSQTLNSFYNAERDQLDGDAKLDFRLAGCGDPNIHRSLETRKGK